MGAQLGVCHDSRPSIPTRAGVLIRLVLLLLRVLFYPLLAWRRARAAPLGSWVELVVDGPLPEIEGPRTLLGRLRGAPKFTLFDLRAVLDELLVDARPRGLLVTLRAFDGGMASALSFREILGRLRAAGRPVVVYVPSGVDTKGYFVASAANHIYAFPGASVALLGFASRGVYVREALAKAGVVAEVLAHGKYKSAGESLTRDAMSEPQREQVGALLDCMYGALSQSLREGRGLREAEVRAAVDQGIFRVPEAVAAKLIDGGVYDDGLAAVLSPGSPSPPRSVMAPAYLRARNATKLGARKRGSCVGVVRVHGAIAQGGTPFSRGAVEKDVVAAIRAARESKAVRGVLLSIDSPGGSALASARIHRELELLATEKPLVACMANVAASGGYYVAAPAHAIVAQPLSITGSIGVIAARFAIEPILKRLGVHIDVLKRGARSDLTGMVRPLTADERVALDREIDGTYEEFLDVVARGRKKTRDEVHALAQGRVWTGEDAHARGLVDLLGGFDVALAEVRRRVGKGGLLLPPRVLRGSAKDLSTFSAQPARNAAALASTWLGAAGGADVGGWVDFAALVTGGERVLVWDPDVVGFRA